MADWKRIAESLDSQLAAINAVRRPLVSALASCNARAANPKRDARVTLEGERLDQIKQLQTVAAMALMDIANKAAEAAAAIATETDAETADTPQESVT